MYNVRTGLAGVLQVQVVKGNFDNRTQETKQAAGMILGATLNGIATVQVGIALHVVCDLPYRARQAAACFAYW